MKIFGLDDPSPQNLDLRAAKKSSRLRNWGPVRKHRVAELGPGPAKDPGFGTRMLVEQQDTGRVVARGCIKGMGRHLDLSKNHFKKHFTQKIHSIGTPWTGKLKLLRPAKTAVLG